MKVGYTWVSKQEQNGGKNVESPKRSITERYILMGALAKFERDLIRERTNAGLVAARARVRVGGRPKKLTTNGKVALARQLFADPNQSISEICSTLEISRSTLYRYVRDVKRAPKSSGPPA